MAKGRRQVADLAAYVGRWVVLSKEKVIAAGATLPEAMSQVPRLKRGAKTSVFLVPRQDEGPYVLVISLPVC